MDHIEKLTLFLTTFIISVNCTGYKLGLPVVLMYEFTTVFIMSMRNYF